MRVKLLLLVFFAALCSSVILPAPDAVQGSPMTVQVSQSMSDYRIEVRLDHVRQNLILELKNAPPLSVNVIEVQTFAASSQSLVTTYIAVHPDIDGYFRQVIPLNSNSTDADIRLTAFAVDSQGILHQSHFWTLERRHFASLGDATVLYKYVDKELRDEAQFSVDRLNPLSPMSMRYYHTGISHLYASDTNLGVGPAAFASSGSLFTGAPSLGMRLSAGPAGVFTAN